MLTLAKRPALRGWRYRNAVSLRTSFPARSSSTAVASSRFNRIRVRCSHTTWITSDLADLESASAWRVGAGGLGTEAGLAHLHRARAALQGIVRCDLTPSALDPLLRGATYVPRVGDGDITWMLRVAPERELAVRAILACGAIVTGSPGRQRASRMTNAVFS